MNYTSLRKSESWPFAFGFVALLFLFLPVFAHAGPGGSINIALAPQGAVDAGAKWRRRGTALWMDSGTTETGVAQGTAEIECKIIPGWRTPSSAIVSVASGQTAHATRTYTRPGIAWSECFGGSRDDYIEGIAIDPVSSDLYISGTTSSSGWVSGGYDTSFGGTSPDFASDAFVARVKRDGTVVWSTYIGGGTSPDDDGSEFGRGIALDSHGNIYVVGKTSAAGWTSGGADTTYNGGRDGFLVKLSPDGALVWSTYIGGSDTEDANRVAIDASDNIYVCGETSSAGWTTGGYDTTLADSQDGFVCKFHPSGDLAWSTYIGAIGIDSAAAIAVCPDQTIAVTGFTYGSGWVSGGFDTTFGGSTDAFVLKLTSDGNPVWSTYFGAAGDDHANGIAADRDGSIYICGDTNSPGLATSGADSVLDGTADAFLCKISGAGQLLWATYAGGSGFDLGLGVAVDRHGNVFLTGAAGSGEWTSTNNFRGGQNDAFVSAFTKDGASLGSFDFGGNDNDICYAIACDRQGIPLIAGYTRSANLDSLVPGHGYHAQNDGFVMALDFQVDLDAVANRIWENYR